MPRDSETKHSIAVLIEILLWLFYLCACLNLGGLGRHAFLGFGNGKLGMNKVKDQKEVKHGQSRVSVSVLSEATIRLALPFLHALTCNYEITLRLSASLHMRGWKCQITCMTPRPR